MALSLTATGLTVETLQEIATSIGNEQLANIDAGLSQDADDPLRQMNVIVSREIQEAVEAIQTSYSAFDIDNAEDDLLDNIGAYKGRARILARNPQVLVRLTLAAGAVVSIGDEVKSNINNARIWKSTVAFIASAAGTFDTVFEATEPTLSALPAELTVFPVITGWLGATNLAASSPARTRETDETYRARLKRNNDTDNGASTLPAIVDEVSQLDGIISVDGRENTSLLVDIFTGMPGMSFEIIVDDNNGTGSTAALIAQTIYDNKPAGGRSSGNILTFAYDKKGRQQPVFWTRVFGYRMYVKGLLRVLPGWQDSQLDSIKVRIAEYFDQLRTGQDVIAGRVKGAILAEPLTEDIVQFYVGNNPAGVTYDQSFPISALERARFDPSDLNLLIDQLTVITP